MGLQLKVLSSPTALSPGSDLWLLPSPDHSAWCRKVDWYLNLQVRNAKFREPKKLSPELQSILSDNEIKLESHNAGEISPLMISVQSRLPCEAAVCLPETQTSKNQEWLQMAVRAWQDLGKPSARVFLPDFLDTEAFKSQWPEDSPREISVVPFDVPLD